MLGALHAVGLAGLISFAVLKWATGSPLLSDPWRYSPTAGKSNHFCVIVESPVNRKQPLRSVPTGPRELASLEGLVCLEYTFARVVLRGQTVLVQTRDEPTGQYVDLSPGGTWPLDDARVCWPRSAGVCMEAQTRKAARWERMQPQGVQALLEDYLRGVRERWKALGTRGYDGALDDSFIPPDELQGQERAQTFAQLFGAPPPGPVEVQGIAPKDEGSSAKASSTSLEDALSPIQPCGVASMLRGRGLADVQESLLALVVSVEVGGVLAQLVGRAREVSKGGLRLMPGNVKEGLWLGAQQVSYPKDIAVGDILRLGSTLRLHDTARREGAAEVIDHVMTQEGLLVLPNF